MAGPIPTSGPKCRLLIPFTSAVAFLGWLYILLASGWNYIAAGFLLLALGILAYLWHARRVADWPFAQPEAEAP